MPLVSVIIPTLRRANLVVRAVNSVLSQSLRDLEIIIVIDGPDAVTVAALALISDVRVRTIQNQVSLGPGGARNIGAACARGDWLAFLDDDDEWLPLKLERQLSATTSPDERVIVTCLSYVITPRRRYLWPRRIYNNVTPMDEYLFDRRSLFAGDSFLATSCMMVPRSLFGLLKFAQRWSCEDWDFWLRATKHAAAQVITVEEPLAIIYIQEDRESLSNFASWRSSLAWADDNRLLIGRRAYSGFCLTVVAPEAARVAEFSAFFILLWRAWRYGRVRVMHLLSAFVFGIIPMKWRRLIRDLLSPRLSATSPIQTLPTSSAMRSAAILGRHQNLKARNKSSKAL